MIFCMKRHLYILDEIRFFFMRKKPTFADVVRTNNNPKVLLAVRVAMNRAGREQNKLLRKATKIKQGVL